MLQRYFIQLSYLGKNYNGWQIQSNAITVQELINKAISTILKEEINTIGAGRTDTGVHAKYFVAHFDSKKSNLHHNDKITYNLNCILPDDIAIKRIFKVNNNNHARFDAISRTYQYFISNIKDPFNKDFNYLLYAKLDVNLMNKATKILYEYEDFTSFSKLNTNTKTNNCKIFEAFWDENQEGLSFTIKANRFLRNMVRSIVGTMIEIGLHKKTLDDFRKIIEHKDRSYAGTSAPAKGLFLTGIEYPYKLE